MNGGTCWKWSLLVSLGSGWEMGRLLGGSWGQTQQKVALQSTKDFTKMASPLLAHNHEKWGSRGGEKLEFKYMLNKPFTFSKFLPERNFGSELSHLWTHAYAYVLSSGAYCVKFLLITFLLSSIAFIYCQPRHLLQPQYENVLIAFWNI